MLFQLGSFVLASGQNATWKTDCDALTDADIETLAQVALKFLKPFGAVEGVPRGGLRLAKALESHVTDGPVLIVDDVLTTGGSMNRLRGDRTANGLVIFARTYPPSWIQAIWQFGLY